jgi:hypothetical protein
LHYASKHIQKLEEVQILTGMLQQVKKIVWHNGGEGGRRIIKTLMDFFILYFLCLCLNKKG